ncbi:alpha-galactosidase [Sanguibacter sp. 25GB23B1]|uniref:alpha-galactosidase n=1 Tax=unclassified Sanguibacter TaxID=2645534 RepID=UPI0032AF6A4C
MHRSQTVLHLRDGGTSVVVDLTTAGLPTIVHWGADLGPIGPRDLAGLALGAAPQRVSGGLDVPARLTLLPHEGFGWQGTPGIEGHRAGRDFSPALTTTDVESTASSLVVTAEDPAAGLTVRAELHVTPAGLVRQCLTVTNTGDTGYEVLALSPTFPLPSTARELLTTTGRHLRERSPQRHDLVVGTHVRESRRGRPGADASLLLAAGTPGFGFERGLVHAVHAAWSGNHRLLAERTPTAEAFLQAAELLLPGEVSLAPGESYASPWAIGSWGDGLDALAARFHTELRARPTHPRRARPVTLNTWEAVYFDHDVAVLGALAERAAAVGVERFVLDDGWFRGRRDDTAGLGDWTVDRGVWPDGLAPLVEQVRGLGMEFGLWVEPEMVNLDSDLARAHPDWILQPGGGRLPVEGRQQHVLDLSHPGAYAHILEHLDALLAEHDIAYLKWDHNRDLVGAGGGAGEDGGPGDQRRPRVHEHTLALYRLLDELKARHPGLEIESCASGGARVDLGILERTDRIWTSDCIDPVERLGIQKYTGLLVPLELLGAHVSGPRSHSTHRTHELDLRAGVALLGHLGIEWDITAISDDEAARLAAWVQSYKDHRELLHTGRLVHADLAEPSLDVRGVVAQDRSHALFTLTQVTTSATYPAGRVTFPGLDPDRSYTVRLTGPSEDLPPEPGPGQSPLLWATDGIQATGRSLATAGVQAPALYPEHLVLVHVTAVS